MRLVILGVRITVSSKGFDPFGGSSILSPPATLVQAIKWTDRPIKINALSSYEGLGKLVKPRYKRGIEKCRDCNLSFAFGSTCLEVRILHPSTTAFFNVVFLFRFKVISLYLRKRDEYAGVAQLAAQVTCND